MPQLPDPVILLPGITASYLRDMYTLPPDLIWDPVFHKNYERATPHPENRRFEAILPAQVLPDQMFEIAYKEMLEEIRHELTLNPAQPVPVYPFGHDWRQPLSVLRTQLGDFVGEVIQRTLLMRHYATNDWAKDPKVTLIGHSMGGLIIAGYLAATGKKCRVRKVVTIATPFRGAMEAVQRVVKGVGSLRERESARLTPSLYHLLPDHQPGLDIAQGCPPTLFDPDVWQTSVTKTIDTALKNYGTGKGDSAAILKQMLDEAQAYRKEVEAFTLADAGLTDNDWLAFVGVGKNTRVKLHVKATKSTPVFSFEDEDVMDRWSEIEPAQRATHPDSHWTGDSTVPFDGAMAPFLKREKMVCLSPYDFEPLELKDKGLTLAEGLHGFLPNMNVLQRITARFLLGTPDKYGATWGRRAPGAATWDPPLKLTEWVKN